MTRKCYVMFMSRLAYVPNDEQHVYPFVTFLHSSATTQLMKATSISSVGIKKRYLAPQYNYI